MRNWKNWLLPILTSLTVLVLALLPLRLSTLRDGELTGTVHAEDLAEDSNFPFKPPELPVRIWLLVRWREMPDQLTIMAQELEGVERDREIQRLQKALKELEDILPPGMAKLLMNIEGDSWEWERYYLRDQTDLFSASFTLAGTHDKKANVSFTATLDVESGQIVDLQVAGADYLSRDSNPQGIGEVLLDRLGLDYELMESELVDSLEPKKVYGLATFRLTECSSWFRVRQSDYIFSFYFRVDWETLERALMESYGYDADAVSMQKR